jgi:TatD DNase family protein
MNFIDSHTHLYLPEFKDDIDEVITRAKEKGVDKFFLPNINSESIPGMLRLCGKYPENCFPMMGLHPSYVNENYGDELENVKDHLFNNNAGFIAVGEIGLDYYWSTDFIEQQKQAFSTQIGLAKQLKLPVVIHNRNSFDDTYKLVKDQMDENLKGVFHCFTGTIEEAEQILSLDFYLGIGGVVTYKNSELKLILKKIPLERIILETDSPYLTPVPFRGKRNESSYVSIIAEAVAEASGISVEKVAEITTQNALNLFRIN